MSEHHQVFDVSRPKGRIQWLFADFWPLMFMFMLFLTMVSLPLTLSGMLHNPLSGSKIERDGVPLTTVQYLHRHGSDYIPGRNHNSVWIVDAELEKGEVRVPADRVWPMYGVLLISEFLVAGLVCFVAPAWLGPYMLLLVIYGLIAAEEGGAWRAGNTPWGSTIALLMLLYMLVGLYTFWRGGQIERKSRL